MSDTISTTLKIGQLLKRLCKFKFYKESIPISEENKCYKIKNHINHRVKHFKINANTRKMKEFWCTNQSELKRHVCPSFWSTLSVLLSEQTLLFNLLKECWGSKLSIIPYETPPKECERNGCCMPQCMSIHIPLVRWEVICLQDHS